MRCRQMIFMSALTAAAQAAAAQTAAPQSTGNPPPACTDASFRQLDFWVGEWKVYDTAKGYQVGTSRIEKIMRGCAIMEHYDSPHAPGGPYSGTSYSSFDSKDGKWRQFYVDVNGAPTSYVGGMQGRDMVLQAPGKAGLLQRMTYRPLEGGAVEQIGTFSTDGGASWKPSYDYTYRR